MKSLTFKVHWGSAWFLVLVLGPNRWMQSGTERFCSICPVSISCRRLRPSTSFFPFPRRLSLLPWRCNFVQLCSDFGFFYVAGKFLLLSCERINPPLKGRNFKIFHCFFKIMCWPQFSLEERRHCSKKSGPLILEDRTGHSGIKPASESGNEEPPSLHSQEIQRTGASRLPLPPLGCCCYFSSSARSQLLS